MQCPITQPILDHGYVRFIEAWGSEERIIESARMSTGKGFLGWDEGECPACGGLGNAQDEVFAPCPTCAGKGTHAGDQRLLNYLYNHNHSTPFEFCGLVIQVKAPIFVFREWHRHRTQSYNEMSARYVPLPNENYIPTVERLVMASTKANKQAGSVAGSLVLTNQMAELERVDLARDYDMCELSYQRSLARGVPKELARIRLPVGRYSKMRAHANLRNWLAFLTLRDAPDAQWEIQQYAQAVARIINEHYPRTYGLFVSKS